MDQTIPRLFDYIHVSIDGILAISMLFGVVKLYYILKFHPPHNHTERGDNTPLTVGGIQYPNNTKEL